MGKSKPVLLLALGIIVALITSFITYDWLQKKAEAKNEAPIKTRLVAVANVDIPWGTVLKKEMIKFSPYLEETLPEGYFSQEATLEGRVVTTPLKENEPVFESRLAPEGTAAGGVAAVISPNKRAMAVKVDKVIGISGFIHPGHRVDVLVTLQRGGQSNPITKIVLENVLVLAAGTKIEKEGNNQKPSQVDVITLEVDPLEAEKLALASTEGKIQLAMRNFNDTKDVLTAGSTKSTLLASYSIQKKKKAARRQRTHTVEVIKGSDVSKVKMGGN